MPSPDLRSTVGHLLVTLWATTPAAIGTPPYPGSSDSRPTLLRTGRGIWGRHGLPGLHGPFRRPHPGAGAAEPAPGPCRRRHAAGSGDRRESARPGWPSGWPPSPAGRACGCCAAATCRSTRTACRSCRSPTTARPADQLDAAELDAVAGPAWEELGRLRAGRGGPPRTLRGRHAEIHGTHRHQRALTQGAPEPLASALLKGRFDHGG